MTLCPHSDALQVDGLCYWDIKQKALNGRRDRLSDEQLGFVGVEPEHGDALTRSPANWLQPVNPSNIDDRLEALATLMDLAPNYIALAREIVKGDE